MKKTKSAILMVCLMTILFTAGTASAGITLLKDEALWKENGQATASVEKPSLDNPSLSVKAAEDLYNKQIDVTKVKFMSAPANVMEQRLNATVFAADPTSIEEKASEDEAKSSAAANQPAIAKEAALPAKEKDPAPKVEPKKTEVKKSEPKKTESKKVESKKVEAKKAEPKKSVAPTPAVKKEVGSKKPVAVSANKTKDAPLVTAANGKTYRYKKALDMKATAYSAAASENGKWGAVDYFGNKLKVGTIAVDPKVIPLGTKVYITGYNYAGLPKGGMIAVASDIGGAIKGNRVDVFVPGSSSEASTFGIQQLKVYIID